MRLAHHPLRGGPGLASTAVRARSPFQSRALLCKEQLRGFVFAMEEKIKAWLFSRGITERQYELLWEQENFRDVIVPFA